MQNPPTKHSSSGSSSSNHNNNPATAARIFGDWKLTERESESMEQLKCRMAEIKNIHFQTDPMFLLKYLRAFDFNVDKSMEIMLKIYAIRKQYPDWFAVKTITDYKDLLSQNTRFMLKGRDKRGRRMIVFKLGNIRPKNTITEAAQLDDIFFECMLSENETQLNGIVVIIDCTDLPWCLLKWCHPKLVKIGSDKSDLLPLKNLEVHVINPSFWLNAVIQAVRPILSKQFQQKFHFHKSGSTASLEQVIGKEYLPAVYGGPDGAEIDYEFSYNYLKTFESFIWNNRQYGIK